jgi:DNA replication protein DnaC
MSLAEDLQKLGLHYTSEQLDDVLSVAAKRKWSATQLLEHIAEKEALSRSQRSLELRLKSSHLGRYKPVCDFDWSWPTSIDRAACETALRLDFLAEAHNILLVAPHGLGKTLLAKNLAHQAVLAGHSALFVTAAQMLLDLGSQDSTRALERRLRYYAHPRLLCIDEIGYLSFDSRNADLLYQVICRRYEVKSVVLTTNLAFSEWPTIFPSATSATALIDRLIHHALILPIEGESYRRREAELAAKSRRSAAAGAKKTAG